MPTMSVNDISMYYEVHGDGQPLVLISGFTADHAAWLTVLDQLAQHYQVIIFDNRGAGQSDAPAGEYSIIQMADDVVELCRQLNISNAHFIGNSMGGYILQTLALRYPDMVDKMIISNSSLVATTTFRYYIEAQYELLKAKLCPEAVTKATLSWVYSYQFLSQPDILEGLIQLKLQYPYPMTLTGYAAQLQALLDFDSTDWANNIMAPTLVVTSDQDLIFSPSLSKQIAEVIPNAELYCFEQAGHLPHIEYPKKFSELALEFFEK